MFARRLRPDCSSYRRKPSTTEDELTGSTSIFAVIGPGLEVVERLADCFEGDSAGDEVCRVQCFTLEEGGGGRKFFAAVVHPVADLHFLHHGGHMPDLVRNQTYPGDDDPTVDGGSIDGVLDEAS
jgi:hypothetical protein